MEINYFILLTILILHWVADFVFQTHDDAVNKSTSMPHLLSHTISYSVSWIFPMAAVYFITTPANIIDSLSMGYGFFLVTFIFHTFTDYYTSRLNSRLWKEERTHDFFVSVGFDQLLHYFQLLFTYELIKALYEFLGN